MPGVNYVPTLGYKSRTAAVLALRAEGLTSAAIAAKIGIEPKTVSALEVSARRQRGPRNEGPSVAGVGPDMLLFPLPVRQLLRPHAVRRGVSLDRLIADIVATIAEEGLVDAVLDDREAVAK